MAELPMDATSTSTSAGGSWFGQWIQSAKEKSVEAISFVKRDLAEFTSTMQDDSVKVATTVKDKLTQENASAATQKVKEGVSTLLGGISKALVIAPSDDYRHGHIVGGEAILFDRQKARLHALQVDPATYTSEPKEERFKGWVESFSMDGKKGDISELLVSNVEVRALYTQLVPLSVSNIDFWRRYYYRLRLLEEDESRRRALKQRADAIHDDDDLQEIDWDDEDDDDDNEEIPVAKVPEQPRTDSTKVIEQVKESVTAQTTASFQTVDPHKLITTSNLNTLNDKTIPTKDIIKSPSSVNQPSRDCLTANLINSLPNLNHPARNSPAEFVKVEHLEHAGNDRSKDAAITVPGQVDLDSTSQVEACLAETHQVKACQEEVCQAESRQADLNPVPATSGKHEVSMMGSSEVEEPIVILPVSAQPNASPLAFVGPVPDKVCSVLDHKLAQEVNSGQISDQSGVISPAAVAASKAGNEGRVMLDGRAERGNKLGGVAEVLEVGEGGVGHHEDITPISSQRTSPSDTKESLDDDWEKDFDVDVSKEELQLAEQAARQSAATTAATTAAASKTDDKGEDWEDW